MQIVPKRKRTYLIYDSLDEFYEDADGELCVENWRRGQEGDWVLTDDGRVLEILKRAEFKSGGNKGKEYVRTVCGTFLVLDISVMDSVLRKNPYSFSSGKTPNRVRRDRKHTNVREDIFAGYVAQGMEEFKAYMLAFPTENPTHAKREAKLLLGYERIRRKVDEKILEIMEAVGLPKRRLIEIGKEILEKKKISDKDRISMLKEFWKASGITSTERRTELTAAVFPGLTGEELKRIMSGHKGELPAAAESITDS